MWLWAGHREGLPCIQPRPALPAHCPQLLAAAQFIFEEKYLVQYRAPVLLAVGLEGFWGVSLCCLALPLLQHVRGPDGLPLDNLQQAIAVSQCSCCDVAGGAC